MKITINQEEKNIPDNTTITQLMELLEMQNKTGIAVAVGTKIVSQSQWSTFVIQENDIINIITASQGG
ncbi:MAG: sulfur carrier protein ThiS [Flavobacteriales bacterium]|jgi:sulfur carrier protein|nr:sulfur carrier protein ThiS [Flavobacteriales bacterium]